MFVMLCLKPDAPFGLIASQFLKVRGRNLCPSEKVLERCEEIQDLGKAIYVYDAMWTEVKCA
jgi:hypothetical protein